MKKIILICLMAAVGTGVRARETEGNIDVRVNRFERVDQTVYVVMDMDISGMTIYPKEAVGLIPVVRNGQTEIELPEVLVNGRNKSKQYRRTAAMTDQLSGLNLYSVVHMSKHRVTEIPYQVAFPYEPWMDGATLDFREDFYGCAGEIQPIDIRGLAQLKQPEPVLAPPPPTIVEVENRYDEIHQLEADIYLHFEVAKYDILPNFADNASELAKAQKLVDSIRNNDNYIIKGIYLTGWASPEATYEYNLTLSRNRANSFRDWLRGKYSLSHDLWHAEGKGEDWTGLERLVQESEMENKDEVLTIIRSDAGYDQKESRLKQLAGGRPWRYMLENYFPKLRRVNCRVEYQIKETHTETKQVEVLP